MTDQQDAMHTLAWEKMQTAQDGSREMVTLQICCTELRKASSLQAAIERIEGFAFDTGLLERHESRETYQWFLKEAWKVEKS